MTSRFPAALLAHSFLKGLNFAPLRAPVVPAAPAASRGARGNHVIAATTLLLYFPTGVDRSQGRSQIDCNLNSKNILKDQIKIYYM